MKKNVQTRHTALLELVESTLCFHNGVKKKQSNELLISDKKMSRKLKIKLYMTLDRQVFCMEQNAGQLEKGSIDSREIRDEDVEKH